VNFLQEFFVHVAGDHPVLQGLVGGVIIAFLNMIGALSVLVWRNPSERALDGALGFAAGAMIYVISDEIIPETHTKGHERIATLGTILGVIVMLYLDVSLA
jgi:zinc transporter, ZIP family